MQLYKQNVPQLQNMHMRFSAFCCTSRLVHFIQVLELFYWHLHGWRHQTHIGPKMWQLPSNHWLHKFTTSLISIFAISATIILMIDPFGVCTCPPPPPPPPSPVSITTETVLCAVCTYKFVPCTATHSIHTPLLYCEDIISCVLVWFTYQDDTDRFELTRKHWSANPVLSHCDIWDATCAHNNVMTNLFKMVGLSKEDDMANLRKTIHDGHGCKLSPYWPQPEGPHKRTQQYKLYCHYSESCKQQNQKDQCDVPDNFSNSCLRTTRSITLAKRRLEITRGWASCFCKATE